MKKLFSFFILLLFIEIAQAQTTLVSPVAGNVNFTGSIGIGNATPAYRLDIVDHTKSAIASFDGAGSTFISIKENGVYRGYFGSYSGAAADVDFGTGAGNTTGNLHFTIQATPKLTITTNGNVGIGTTTPSYKLDVCGTVRAKEYRTEAGWCDYVFDKGYKLAPLSDVEKYIKANKHLPGVTPGSQIEKEGLELGKVSTQMIKKIEELTLYIIEQEKAINNLKAQNSAIKAQLKLIAGKGRR